MTGTAARIDSTCSGRVIATSHKREDERGFPDFMEKSETGAIGRALALCGFGTQFCADELDEGSRLADSPISKRLGIHPEQPGEGNGNTEPLYYKISFGKWAQLTLEDVHQRHGEKAIADYIAYLEDSAKKKGQDLSDRAKEFIGRASDFLAALERNYARAEGCPV